MVATINEGLKHRWFGLSPGENWWPGAGATDDQYRMAPVFRFTLAGGLHAVASVTAISGDELSIHAVLNPQHVDVQPDLFAGFKEGDAYAGGWLERRLGAWIQDGGEQFSCRRNVLREVAALVVEPSGYADQGSFIM